LKKFLSGDKDARAPEEYIDYVLCKTFGWTPEQLERQDSQKIEEFLLIINLEREVQDDEIRREKNSNL